MAKRFFLGFITLTAAACANQTRTAQSVSGTWFNCEDGLIFSAQKSKDRMLIVIADGRRFELLAAPTSFGQLFRSAGTTLRIDDDFAVLVGGPVQNHTRCRLMGREA